MSIVEAGAAIYPILPRDTGKAKSSPSVDELLFWQREKDSNPHIRSQSPLCYLYTIPLNA